jgi:hypothetical protein
MTLISYGEIAQGRQADLMRSMGKPEGPKAHSSGFSLEEMEYLHRAAAEILRQQKSSKPWPRGGLI